MNWLAILLFLFVTVACTKKETTSEAGASSPQMSAADLIAAGQKVYNQNCIACHNSDPSKDGPTGPAVKGSTLELLEARILTPNYPPGYKPKRETQVMPTFVYLKKDIPALHAFLSQ